jgi:hypothetical protein
LFGWGEYVPEPYGLSCTIAWHSYHTSFKDAFYVICSFSCFMLVPVLLIVTSQIQILYKVYHFTYALSARGIRTNLRHAEKRLSMVRRVLCHAEGGTTVMCLNLSDLAEDCLSQCIRLSLRESGCRAYCSAR